MKVYLLGSLSPTASSKDVITTRPDSAETSPESAAD